MLLTFPLKLQFLKAVGVAFWYALIRWDKPWKRFKGFFKLVLSKDRAPHVIEWNRNDKCETCPIFYRPLQTCGSPLDKRLDGLGCWCHTPTKNRLKGATCWLTENTDSGKGWSKELYGKTE